MNEKKPAIIIEKKLKGGVEILGNPGLSQQTIKSLSREFKIPNAKISFREKVGQDQFIDALIASRVYVPAIKVVSKIDLLPKNKQKELVQEAFLDKSCLFISSKDNIGVKELKEKIFEKLEIIRIYLRQNLKTKEEKPLICKKGVTVLEAAQKISEELAQEIKGAKIKGKSVRYADQFVGLKHKLQDQDQVFFIK